METPASRDFLKKFKKRLKKDYWVIKIRRQPWLKWVLLGFLSFATGSYYAFYYYTGNIPFVGDLNDDNGKPLDFSKLAHSDFKKASYAYAYDNKTKIGVFNDEIRDPLRASEIPAVVKNAFIAAEDQRFYNHSGIDPLAIGRATFGNLLFKIGIEYWTKSGASGINQQVARRIFEEEVADFRNRAPTFKRKIKEARVAIKLDRMYPKEKILEASLNLPWLGNGAYGVAEATRLYFGKNIRTEPINLREASILASLNKYPSKYSPIFKKPEEIDLRPNSTEKEKEELKKRHETELAIESARLIQAKDHYNWVLKRMEKEGFISRSDYTRASFKKEESLQPDVIKLTPLKNQEFGYGTRLVKEMLMHDGYKDEEITTFGGLRIRTCIDADIQKIVNEEIARLLAELNKEVENPEKLHNVASKTNPIDGSAVMVDVKTGCVTAIVGGHNYLETPYDRAMALRSVGSAVKPFVYTAAFEAGKTFDDTIGNSPFRMRGAYGKPWVPKNFREDNPVPLGQIPIYVGQIRSVNLPTLRLAMEIGMGKVVDTMHRMGIWGVRGIIKDPGGNIIFRMPGIKDTGDGIIPLLPTAIGASDVNLLELVNAYAVFFRDGLYLPPKLVLEVKDQDGELLYQAPESKTYRSISKETALKELILMRATTKVGTAKISMRNIEQQVACKTGTSNNPNEELGEGPGDVSTVCGTPEFVMGIRIGHDMPRPIVIPRYMQRVSGRANMQVSGGWVVGPLTRRIWDKIYTKRPKVKFPQEVETGLQELLAIYPDRYK
ncbi:MAG: transglycosylase domain-containing protein [Candidatus Yanofskybacteria bacterium]|nr:transglycosylase domain-containing protein [Candidatus Yanofskybacteria bacterium]